MCFVLRTLLLTACLWLVTGLPAGAASCGSPAIDHAAAKVREARVALGALPIYENSGPTSLTPQAQAVISEMKTHLRDFLDAYMRCLPPNFDTAGTQDDLGRRFEQREVEPIGAVHYGDHLTFSMQRPAGHPDLVAITANFAIECGTDTVLFLFSSEGGSWSEILRWQSRPYPEINGAFASFSYGVSPPDELGHWFVVTKTVAPWCSSTWSVIRYSVLRPRADRVTPRVIYDADDPIWWGGEDFGQLNVDRNSFDLRFHADSIDLGIHSRLWIRHFAVEGDEVRRVAPIALSPRDFVDEWMTSPWNQASSWSRTEARPALKSWHERLQALRPTEYYAYGAIRRCGDGAARYQVELKSDAPDRDVYLQLEESPSAFDMIAVGAKPDPSCGGPDLLDSMATQ